MWRWFGELSFVPARTPSEETTLRAARKIEPCRSYGPVLVSCALGYSRSACAVAPCLLVSGRASTVNNAISIVRAAQNKLVLGEEELKRIADAAGNKDLSPRPAFAFGSESPKRTLRGIVTLNKFERILCLCHSKKWLFSAF